MGRLPVTILLCVLLASMAGCAGGTPDAAGASATAAPSTVATSTVPPATTSPPTTAPPTGRPPTLPSPGAAPSTSTPLLFLQIAGEGAGAAEVTAPEQLDRFLVGAPDADQQARDAARRARKPGVRLFAFLLSGCQNDGASLVIESTRVSAVLTGGEDIRCLVAEHYLALFAVPASLIPPGARVG
jgi:hypothetical protein